MPKRTPGMVAARAFFFLALLAACGTAVYFACTLAFRWAQNVSNMFVLATEGAKLRAQAVLENEDTPELANFFTEEFLAADPLLKKENNPFTDFYITTYSYDAKVKNLALGPLATTGTVELEERVSNIRGSGSDAAGTTELPAWQNARYLVTLAQDKAGRWYITKLETLAVILPPPTPTPSAPPATDTPAADVEAQILQETPAPSPLP